METSPKITEVGLVRNQKVTYEKKIILGGLISWWRRVNIERIGDDLVIQAEPEIDRIIFNGKVIYGK